jgi:hypothetical protein
VDLLGKIEPDAGVGSGKAEWHHVIDAHPQLSRGQAKEGINPFDGKPHLYTANPYAAAVMIDGRDVGAIDWAIDNSRLLVVWSAAGAEEKVIGVAMDVAARLGWHFVRSKAVGG